MRKGQSQADEKADGGFARPDAFPDIRRAKLVWKTEDFTELCLEISQ